VVRVEFDPSVISLDELLSVFFTIHDPTTLNRQGNDVGTQYRSVIFYESEEQKATAQKVIASLESTGTWNGIVTEVKPLPEFYPAESYHQRYYEKNPEQAYCQIVINPKLAKLREKHADLLK
jgi:peptide-methionine (S)-S-oxide reductase